MAVTRRWSMPWAWDQKNHCWRAAAYSVTKVRNGWDLKFRTTILGAHPYPTVEAAWDAADRHRGIGNTDRGTPIAAALSPGTYIAELDERNR